MKHYVLDDNIRNLLMQTILKEEDAQTYAKKLAAGDPNDPSEEGRGGDAKEYLKIRAEKEKAAKAKEAAKKPVTPKDRRQPTKDPKIMAARKAELAKAAEGAVGDDDPTDHMRGRVRNPHTDPKARREMQDTAEKFAAIERNARARDAERAAKRKR